VVVVDAGAVVILMSGVVVTVYVVAGTVVTLISGTTVVV
jgi:hypothetical protein